MRITILSVSGKQPEWLMQAVDEFAKRLKAKVRVEFVDLKAEPRSIGRPVDTILKAEADRLSTRLPRPCRRIVLDERGTQKSTRQLAEELEIWKREGTHTVFVIGGPDGLDSDFKKSADQTWALSKLTLPHGLARLILIEQIYRANSLLEGHPYHRE
jgi:23S rRNA (pseudouridine1915-N3)-methyltransferase